MGRNQGRFDNDQAHTISRPIGAVVDSSIDWLPIDTTVPGDGSHTDPIPQRQGTGKRDRFENFSDHYSFSRVLWASFLQYV